MGGGGAVRVDANVRELRFVSVIIRPRAATGKNKRLHSARSLRQNNKNKTLTDRNDAYFHPLIISQPNDPGCKQNCVRICHASFPDAHNTKSINERMRNLYTNPALYTISLISKKKRAPNSGN
jgi:hypothetical protein